MAELDSEKPVYSIGIVQEKTGLTGRQIRYYEESELIKPARTKGNQRIYSQSDIEKLKEIKEMLEKGLNIAGIKEKLGTVNEVKKKKKTKISESLYDGRPLTKFNRGKRGLTSLYPVSDRAQLLEILDKKDNDKD
ncbi:MerR family transcriptional regulator [Orenia metallireducens]|jgi:MerR family glutamine synthetase transcriptional repressor|uniref:MerR family transcriptional regulator n=1 Tax=Orenia metallireducens TaxID=1413210 RepID=A0A1C0A6J9_9FIRM|nr:MerR family transcriptional regulator [Orenia metallireducens]OCL25757.1 MerR family transcriptional regulator [Orenia metallireducens]